MEYGEPHGQHADRSVERRVADILVDVLVENGVRVIFGLPGGPISPIHDALIDHPEVRLIHTRHEAAAMFAAAAYAQTSGKLGVVLVTSGPGILNALTGLASAWCDGLPVLLLGGEVPRRLHGRGALQDGSSYHLQLVSMAASVTKLAAEVYAPDVAPAMVRRAIATAMSGKRGPVMLTLPMDVTTATVHVPDVSLEISTTMSIPSRVVDRVAGMLRDARRAVVFAGAGVRWGRGPIALRDLAERAQIPVMTTPKAKGVFPEDHPLSLGVFGMGGHPSATAYLKEGVDVLIAVGNGLGDLATDGWTDLLKPQVALVQVDIEASRLGRSYPIDLGIGAPADLFLEQLTVRLPQASPLELPGISHFSPPGSVTCGDEGAIAPQRVLWELQQILPTDTIFSCDSGEHFVFATHYLRTNSADAHIAMTGLGSMGSSIPAAIGAKLARPHRMSAAICGDGCFAMNAFEISTAVAAGLPILVVVMNDGRLGMVEIGHRAVYGRAPAYPTNPLDVQAVALGLGAQSYLIQRPNEILTLGLPERLRAGPVVLDVHIDRTIRMPKRDRFDAFSGGGRKPSPRPLIN